jgi:hypothetical protein
LLAGKARTVADELRILAEKPEFGLMAWSDVAGND